MEREPKKSGRRWGLWQFVLLGFFVLLVGLAVAAVATRQLWPRPAVQQAALAPTPSPTTTPSPTPSPSPSPSPSPTQPPAEYVRTAVVADGQVLGVLASLEAAEELLSEVLEHYTGLVRAALGDGAGELTATFKTELLLTAAQDGAETVTLDELMALLTGEDTPIEVEVLSKTYTTTELPFDEREEDDEYLVKGTRIVVSQGRAGLSATTTTLTFINGELEDESSHTETLLEAVDAVVRLGTQKLSDREPNRSQGREGEETEQVFSEPLEGGEIVSNFGQRHGVLHLGLDYEADDGAAVLASAGGVVAAVMERGGYGLMVEIDHAEGFTTRYAHLATATVELGQQVTQGQAIGTLGQSGNAKEPHLHFELRIGGEAYNPRYYLAR